jgi:hypothetical protein
LTIAFYASYGIEESALFAFFQVVHIVMGFVRFTSFTAGGTIMTALFIDEPDFRSKFALYKSSTHLSALLGIATISYYEFAGFTVTMCIPAVLSVLVCLVNFYALPSDQELSSLERIMQATSNAKSSSSRFLWRPRTITVLLVLLWCHTLLRYGVGGASFYFEEYYLMEQWQYALVLIASCLPSLFCSLFLGKIKGDIRVSVFFFSSVVPGIGCFFAKPLFGEVNIVCTFIFLVLMWEAITFVNVLIIDDILKYLEELYPNMPRFLRSKLASSNP